MWSFLIDEDMPRSTAAALRRAGHLADDVRDVGLRGHPDDEIYARAQEMGAILVSADLGFANVLAFPLGTHAGIVLTRMPNSIPSSRVIDEILQALNALAAEDLRGLLVVVEIGRVRIRRPLS